MSDFESRLEKAKKISSFWTERMKIDITTGVLRLINPGSISHEDLTELVENSIEDGLRELKARDFYFGDLNDDSVEVLEIQDAEVIACSVCSRQFGGAEEVRDHWNKEHKPTESEALRDIDDADEEDEE